MNFKFAWILFAILIVGLGALLVSSLLDDRPEAGAILLEPLAAVKAADIDAVEIVRSGAAEEKIAFARTGKDRWDITSPAKAKADAFVLKKVIEDLLALKPTPSADVTDNKTVHGLDKPGIRVTLKSGAKSATLNVGDTTIGRTPVTFVTTSTRPNVPVAVLRSDLDGLFRPGTTDGKSADNARRLSDYRQKQFFKGENDLLAESDSITLAKGGKETRIVRNPGTGDWSFAAPAGFGVADLAGDPQAPPATFTGVRPLVTAITGLQTQASEDYLETPESLEKYGLKPDDANVIRVEVKPKDGPPELLFIGKKIDDKPETTKFYCKAANDTAVAIVSITQDRVTALGKIAMDPTDLRDRSVIPDLKQLTIDAIDIASGGTNTKLRRLPMGAESRWVLYGGPSDPQLAGTNVQELLTALAKPRLAKDVLLAPNDAAFDGPERKAELKFWYDGLAKSKEAVDPEKLPAEPKFLGEGKPSLTLLFGKKEGDSVFVRRTTADGIVTDLKLPESTLPVAVRDRLAYLDPKLKPFATNTVKKLSFNRGEELFAIESDGKAHEDQWKFLAPERLKGLTADGQKVNSLLAFATMLSPTRIVAENPTEADAAKYGIGGASQMKLVLNFDTDKEKERIYEFGSETEDKNFTYFRSNTRAAVSAMPKFVRDRFLTDDLRDRRLYQIDPTKVKAVVLHGWKQALKQPVKYRFKRTGETWSIEEPAGAKPSIDPAKMEIFLASLAVLRATDYVPGTITAEQGFDVANGTNSLEVTLEIENHPGIALHFANETDGGASYFGWCSLKKDDVFKIASANLRLFKEKPEAFFK